jgi:hypothetical protein
MTTPVHQIRRCNATFAQEVREVRRINKKSKSHPDLINTNLKKKLF